MTSRYRYEVRWSDGSPSSKLIWHEDSTIAATILYLSKYATHHCQRPRIVAILLS